MKREFFVTILLIFMPGTVWASVAGEVNKANDFYKQGKIDDSLDLYQQALAQNGDSSLIKYDLGTAFYKKGDYAKALEYLRQAEDNKNLKIKTKVEYNLGNALYKAGRQKENVDVGAAIKSMQEALGHYQSALAIDSKDTDASFNENFVKKEIERLKRRPPQQQPQNQQQQNQNQQKQQNQKGQQGQQQQQQNQQNQKNQQQQGQQQQNQQQAQQNQGQQKQGSQQQSSGTQPQKQQSAQDQAGQDQKELDKKQAEDLLEDYLENEEPKKLLNYMPKKIDNRPVLKDW